MDTGEDEATLDEEIGSVHDTEKQDCKEKKKQPKSKKKPKKYDSSLVWAVFHTFRVQWTLAGLLKLGSGKSSVLLYPSRV